MSSLSWNGITFGVELEFMAPPPDREHWKLYTPSAGARANVSKLLSQHTTQPITCECEHNPIDICCVCADIPANCKVDARTCVINPPGQIDQSRPATAYFHFMYEYLQCVKDLNAERCWPGVEMCTPILGQAELASGLPAVKDILSGMRKTGVPITADDCCGMHVHVGVEEGMTVYLAKRIATLVVLLENTLILRFVAPSRWVSEYATTICEDSQAAKKEATICPAELEAFEKHMPPRSRMHPSKWNSNDPKMYYRTLRTIWSCEDLEVLDVQLRRNGLKSCGLALSLRNYKDRNMRRAGENRYEGTPSTVEFRYAQMSFDHVLIRNWVEVMARIVDLARAQDDEFKEIVSTIIDVNYEAVSQRTSAWKPLLKQVFKLEHRIPDWEAQLEKFNRDEGESEYRGVFEFGESGRQLAVGLVWSLEFGTYSRASKSFTLLHTQRLANKMNHNMTTDGDSMAIDGHNMATEDPNMTVQDQSFNMPIQDPNMTIQGQNTATGGQGQGMFSQVPTEWGDEGRVDFTKPIEDQWVSALDILSIRAEKAGITPKQAVVKLILELDIKHDRLLDLAEEDAISALRGEPDTEDRNIRRDYIKYALDAVDESREKAYDLLRRMYVELDPS
ncbi:unnamed protein product [Fusarium graminearum]|nr:unnamed protein product [Fusarium graminearum]